MEQLGRLYDRQIFYTNIWKDKDWNNSLPNNNWAVFSIGRGNDVELDKMFASRCIDNNVLYLCAAGPGCESLHDLFDLIVVEKKIEKGESTESPDDFENSPMTTWHNNFSEGFWFAAVCTNHDSAPIDQIACIDFTKQGVKKHLIDLINKINNDWLPSDEEHEEPVYDKP